MKYYAEGYLTVHVETEFIVADGQDAEIKAKEALRSAWLPCDIRSAQVEVFNLEEIEE
ncbi:hypothetical protein [Desulfobulbus sp.]|uniref:hypothetical protein n=1 Tax=Desulfobulbus sp. TaxID=895 RepID=UPI00286EBE0D|nr:hypothetical protein [Desulfobulbus sp.]